MSFSKQLEQGATANNGKVRYFNRIDGLIHLLTILVNRTKIGRDSNSREGFHPRGQLRFERRRASPTSLKRAL